MIRIDPRESEVVLSRILEVALETHDKMSPWMNRRECADRERIEDAEDVELSLLREVCAIGENRKRNVHREKVEARTLSC
jgi:hypothetical protein